MVEKHLICPERKRKIPKSFSWLDHRLVSDHHIERLSHQAAALYLFLVTVADAQGLSYYSEKSILQRLTMDASSLTQARHDLIRNRLIAYQTPLYQVLALDRPIEEAKRYPGEIQSLAHIFKQIGEAAS
jgi:hypothetical protein